MPRHFHLSPSASHRWLNCPGSLSEKKDSPSSDYADEGAKAHALAEHCLRSGKDCDDDNVMYYVDECRSLSRRGDVVHRDIEVTLVSTEIDGLGGTLDYLVLYEESGVLVAHLSDLKFGQGVAVHAAGNMQLMTYAVIVDETFARLPDKFRITIVQPRCPQVDDVQEVEVSRAEVEAHREHVVSVLGKSHRRVGSWCRWCPLAVSCDAMRAHTLKLAREEFDLADVVHLAELMKVTPAVKDYLDRIPVELLRHMQKGTTVPGFKAIRSQSNRKWRGSVDEICRVLGDDVTERRLLSPAQAEKRGHDVSELTYRDDGPIRIVPDSHRAKPVSFLEEFND